MLICPKCKTALYRESNSFVCKEHHTFDIAKRGYCNLLLGNRKTTGDDGDMVKARTKFLYNAYYEPLRSRIIEIIDSIQPKTMIDAGCGEGYYTNEIKKALPNTNIIGIDLSKTAVDEACKGKTSVQYVVSSVFDMPIKSDNVDLVISIFAPIKEQENYRILKQNGYFLKVEPGPKHLYQLKQVLYADVYENEEQAVIYENFQLVKEELLDYEITIPLKEDIKALFQMTPYYWKTAKEASDRLYALDSLSTRVQFHIELYKKI